MDIIPETAENNAEAELKNTQTSKESQTASEYVPKTHTRHPGYD